MPIVILGLILLIFILIYGILGLLKKPKDERPLYECFPKIFKAPSEEDYVIIDDNDEEVENEA